MLDLSLCYYQVIMEPQTIEQANVINTKTSKFSIKTISVISLAIIAAVALVLGSRWLYSKYFVSMQNQIGDLKVENYWRQVEIADLTNNRAYINDQVNYLLTQQSTASAGSYATDYVRISADIDIESHLVYTPDALKQSGYQLLLIDYLAKNKSTQNAYFYSGDLKVKDSDNYQYQTLNSSGYASNEFVLPGGRTHLDYINLNPGEETRGTLVYLITRDIDTVRVSDAATDRPMADLNL